MKRFFVSLSLVLLVMIPRAGAATGAPALIKPVASTNDMQIWADNGVDFISSPLQVQYRVNVKVLHPQIYMESEILDVFSQTNATGGVQSTNIDRIVARTNVLIMVRDTTIIGDLAVYTATNEMVTVTGVLVVIDNDKFFALGTDFEMNVRTAAGRSKGPTATTVKLGTNSALPNPVPRRTGSPPGGRPSEKGVP